MALRPAIIDHQLAAIDGVLTPFWRGDSRGTIVEKLRADLLAARFHLQRPQDLSPIVAILGGTGTGKSTLLNRILDAKIAAASFRRTFTAGPIAVVGKEGSMPSGWLGVPHAAVNATELPSRGEADQLVVTALPHELTHAITIIDTPDLDGDQSLHHARADRVFRWIDAAIFLVTPEKYQMTELLPYYRLARRYGVKTFYVMNKVDEAAAVEDYQKQLGEEKVYAIARDDAAYEPPAEINLAGLRAALISTRPSNDPHGRISRILDILDRVRDQILEPSRKERREAEQLIASLRAMETPLPGVDVNPLTQQLQRRLQQRSVLYLMGPGRVLDRVRQVPGILARLPRTTWDLLRTGKLVGNEDDELLPDSSREKPDFQTALIDQFTVLQSRIDDSIRSHPLALRWLQIAVTQYVSSKISPQRAAAIVDDEIGKLQHWLEKQWNATPRDTAVIEKLLKVLPGGKKIAKWSEAAPYLLAIAVATHHVFFGHIDLLILGGFSLATWLSEKLSNQVSAKTRAANNAIATRFTELAHTQIEQTCAWIDQQAPKLREIENLSAMVDQISEALADSEHHPDSAGGKAKQKRP